MIKKYIEEANFEDTGFSYTLSLINGKYKMVILYCLMEFQPVRFNELQRYLKKISDKTLSQNLKELDSKIADNLMINTFDEIISKKIKIDDWRLILVNFENDMPENFTVNLASIDEYRAVDSRIIVELMQMLKAMKADGASKIWIQSAYRSIDHQKELYDNRVKEYLAQGKSREEAETLTEQTINKPQSSEHNLGLAVDFNYVDYNFEKTAEYTWLLENARNYGFILRYPREKEDITKVDFEPWHWRYVGAEHAKKITELDMCLEEYIEYLIDNQF